MSRYRIILADDQVLFVESLARVIKAIDPDLDIVGIARDGAEAVSLVTRLDPDAVLMDVRMPSMDGVEATREIHARFPSVKIVMLTTFDDDTYVLEALRSGAVGYLLKDIEPQQLVGSLRAAIGGTVLMSSAVVSRLVNIRSANHPGHERSLEWLEGLGRREREILKLVCEGCDNKEIAARLFIAEQTVRNHISVIYAKSGARDRIKLIDAARRFMD